MAAATARAGQETTGNKGADDKKSGFSPTQDIVVSDDEISQKKTLIFF
jgi:hypothetical protein